MTDKEYRAADGINISALKLMKTSPRHYKWGLNHPRADSAAMAFGRAVHMMVLEPSKFPGTYAINPVDMKLTTKDGKAWKAEVIESGLEILTHNDYINIQMIAQNVKNHAAAGELLQNQKHTEMPLFWLDEETSLYCKGKADLVLNDGTLVDLKTTRDISPDGFFRQAYNLGYHLQAAFYHDGLVANGIDVPCVKIMAVEGTGPFDVAVYQFGKDEINQGRIEYRELLQQVKECRETDIWPGVCPDTADFRLPNWARWDISEVDDADGIIFD